MTSHVLLEFLAYVLRRVGFKDWRREVKCPNREVGFGGDWSWKQKTNPSLCPMLRMEGWRSGLNLHLFFYSPLLFLLFLFVPVGTVIHFLKDNNRTVSSGHWECRDQQEILRNLESGGGHLATGWISALVYSASCIYHRGPSSLLYQTQPWFQCEILVGLKWRPAVNGATHVLVHTHVLFSSYKTCTRLAPWLQSVQCHLVMGLRLGSWSKLLKG